MCSQVGAMTRCYEVPKFRRNCPLIVSIPVTTQRGAEAAKHCCPGWTRFSSVLMIFSTEIKTMLSLLWEVTIIINSALVQSWAMGKSCGRCVCAV